MIRFLVGVILFCVAFWIAVPTLIFGVVPGVAGLVLLAATVNEQIVKATAPMEVKKPVAKSVQKSTEVRSAAQNERRILDDPATKRRLLKAGALLRWSEERNEYGMSYPQNGHEELSRLRYTNARMAYVLASMKLQGIERNDEMIDKLTEANFVVRPGVAWDYQERAEVREHFMSKAASSLGLVSVKYEGSGKCSYMYRDGRIEVEWY